MKRLIATALCTHILVLTPPVGSFAALSDVVKVGRYETEILRVEVGPCDGEVVVLAKYVLSGVFGDPGPVVVRLHRDDVVGPVLDTAASVALIGLVPQSGSLLAYDRSPGSTYVLGAQHMGERGEVWLSEVKLFARCV